MNRQITLGAFLAVFVAGCGDKAPPMPDNVVAQVGATLITPEALIIHVRESWQQASDEAVDQSLEEMIRFEAAYAKATQEAFERSPQVQAAIRSNLPSAAANDEAIRSAAVKQIVVNRFLETHLGLDVQKVVISEDEIRDYFRKNPDKFNTPEGVRAAAIVIRTPESASAAERASAHERAEMLHRKAAPLSELQAFGAFAADNSDDVASRSLGGDTGWISTEVPNGWPTNLIATLLTLQPGGVTPVVEAPDGFYLARLLKKRPPSVAPWVDARERIRYELATKKEAERERAFFTALKRDVYLRVNPELLKAIKRQLGTNQQPTTLQASQPQN